MALLLFVSFASAANGFDLSIVDDLPSTVNAGQEYTVKVNFNNTNVTYGAVNVSFDKEDTSIWTPLPANQSIAQNTDSDFTLKLTIPSDATGTFLETLRGYYYNGTDELSYVQATFSSTVASSTPTPVTPTNTPDEIDECILIGDADDDLDIDLSVDVKEGFGEDNEWLPFDEIEVEVEVENNNNDYEIEDIEISWGLYNVDKDDWYIDDKESDFNLDDGEDNTITFTFELDEDLEDLADGDYIFYVWARGTMDNDSETEICVSANESIDMQIESDFIILKNIQMPEEATCGMDVQLTADLWNIGDKDQEDLYVKIYNKALGIDEIIDYDELEAFEDAKLTLNFVVPNELEEQQYNLEIGVYDEDHDLYENDYDDEESEYNIPLKVTGCSLTAKASISASLESEEAKAGEELVIKATVTNTGSDTETFTIDAAEYSGWASLASQSQNTVLLTAGQSQDITLTFNVNEDVDGDQTFNINVISSTGATVTQPMRVTIEGKSGLLPGLGDNAIVYGALAVFAIFIVILVFLIIKVLKK